MEAVPASAASGGASASKSKSKSKGTLLNLGDLLKDVSTINWAEEMENETATATAGSGGASNATSSATIDQRVNIVQTRSALPSAPRSARGETAPPANDASSWQQKQYDRNRYPQQRDRDGYDRGPQSRYPDQRGYGYPPINAGNNYNYGPNRYQQRDSYDNRAALPPAPLPSRDSYGRGPSLPPPPQQQNRDAYFSRPSPRDDYGSRASMEAPYEPPPASHYGTFPRRRYNAAGSGQQQQPHYPTGGRAPLGGPPGDRCTEWVYDQQFQSRDSYDGGKRNYQPAPNQYRGGPYTTPPNVYPAIPPALLPPPSGYPAALEREPSGAGADYPHGVPLTDGSAADLRAPPTNYTDPAATPDYAPPRGPAPAGSYVAYPASRPESYHGGGYASDTGDGRNYRRRDDGGYRQPRNRGGYAGEYDDRSYGGRGQGQGRRYQGGRGDRRPSVTSTVGSEFDQRHAAGGHKPATDFAEGEERIVERPKLALQPRTKPVDDEIKPPPPADRSSAIFGGAKPVDTRRREQEIEEKIKREKEELEAKKEKKLSISSSIEADAENGRRSSIRKTSGGHQKFVPPRQQARTISTGSARSSPVEDPRPSGAGSDRIRQSSLSAQGAEDPKLVPHVTILRRTAPPADLSIDRSDENHGTIDDSTPQMQEDKTPDAEQSTDEVSDAFDHPAAGAPADDKRRRDSSSDFGGVRRRGGGGHPAGRRGRGGGAAFYTVPPRFRDDSDNRLIRRGSQDLIFKRGGSRGRYNAGRSFDDGDTRPNQKYRNEENAGDRRRASVDRSTAPTSAVPTSFVKNSSRYGRRGSAAAAIDDRSSRTPPPPAAAADSAASTTAAKSEDVATSSSKANDNNNNANNNDCDNNNKDNSRDDAAAKAAKPSRNKRYSEKTTSSRAGVAGKPPLPSNKESEKPASFISNKFMLLESMPEDT